MADALRMARVLDALRGGDRAHQFERDALRRVTVAWPGAALAVTGYDRLASGTAARAVEGGATAVVFGAAGFPAPGGPLHAEAAAASRTARCLYASGNPVIATIRAGSLARDDRAGVLPVSVLDPAALLKAVRGEVGEAGPFMVSWGLAAGFLDARRAAEAVALYREMLPPGSTLVIAALDGPEARRLAMLCGAVPHPPGDVAAWLNAAGFAPDGGGAWGDEPARRIVAAVARVP